MGYVDELGSFSLRRIAVCSLTAVGVMPVGAAHARRQAENALPLYWERCENYEQNILCELLLTPHQLICHINMQQGLTNSPRGSRANWDRSELDIKADFNAKSKFHTMYSCVNTVYCCVK